MADPSRVPVCSWPDGRVLYRTPSDWRPSTTVQFTMGREGGDPREVEFSFHLDPDGRVASDTFPGRMTRKIPGLGQSEANRKILWFALAAGLAGPDQILRRTLLSGYQLTVVPGALPEGFRVEEVHLPDLDSADEAAVTALVQRTFPVTTVHLWRYEVGTGGISFRLNVDLPVLDSSPLLISVRPTAWMPWGVCSRVLERTGTGTQHGHTLGGAFLDLMEDAQILVGDQVAAWEATLEPGQLLLDDSVFRLLGEPSPLFLPMERLSEWVSRG